MAWFFTAIWPWSRHQAHAQRTWQAAGALTNAIKQWLWNLMCEGLTCCWWLTHVEFSLALLCCAVPCALCGHRLLAMRDVR